MNRPVAARRSKKIRSRAVTAAPAAMIISLALFLLIATGRKDQSDDAVAATVLIDINIADENDIRLLPGIGPAIAERIVADRDSQGPFDSIEDLTRVRGVGERTILNLRPYVVVNPPSPEPSLN